MGRPMDSQVDPAWHSAPPSSVDRSVSHSCWLGTQPAAMPPTPSVAGFAAAAVPPAFPLWRVARSLGLPQAQRHLCCTASAGVAVQAAPTAAEAPLPPAPAQQRNPGAAAAAQFVSWPGLHAWRAADVDLRTEWGPKGPVAPAGGPGQAAAGSAGEEELQEEAAAAAALPASLAECARAVLLTADPLGKVALTHRAWRAYCAGRLPVGTAEPLQGPPARPAKPELVPPRRIPSMDKSPLPKAVYMLHNLAHVELNAIDLSWDTLLRFSSCGLPEAFYADFARVADDESRHLGWCLQRLQELGYEYGSMPAHNLLWEGAEASAGDLGARLAIVPMSQEARGLDAGGRLTNRLVGMGDNRTAAIVRRISEEERAHVAVGVTWFSAICAALGQDPGPTFRSLLLDLCPGLLKGPFNDAERGVVGLPRDFYDVHLWPPPEREAAQEALAATAAAERAGQQQPGSVAASSSGGGGGGAGGVWLAPVADEARLQQLAARLAAMLELEAGNACMA